MKSISILSLFVISLLINITNPLQSQSDTCKAWVLYYSVKQLEEEKKFVYHLTVMSDCYLDSYPYLVSYKESPKDLSEIRTPEPELKSISDFYSIGEYYYNVHSHTFKRDKLVKAENLNLYLVTMEKLIPFKAEAFDLYINPKNSIQYQLTGQSILMNIADEWQSGKLIIYEGDRYHHILEINRDEKSGNFEYKLNDFIQQFCRQFSNNLRFIFISNQNNKILYADPNFRMHPSQFGLQN